LHFLSQSDYCNAASVSAGEGRGCPNLDRRGQPCLLASVDWRQLKVEVATKSFRLSFVIGCQSGQQNQDIGDR
jgi:hypothetical protein